jgi:hypothetical protein
MEAEDVEEEIPDFTSTIHKCPIGNTTLYKLYYSIF